MRAAPAGMHITLLIFPLAFLFFHGGEDKNGRKRTNDRYPRTGMTFQKTSSRKKKEKEKDGRRIKEIRCCDAIILFGDGNRDRNHGLGYGGPTLDSWPAKKKELGVCIDSFCIARITECCYCM